ncbi:MAG: lipopolysaccharide biosynthesis protein [Sphingomonadaceae bacterium]|nr:lipopolysaccharide biosynthesis protein [Sphingomonadaceae bacterium]
MKFERSDKNVGNRVFKGAVFMTGARFILRLFSLINLMVLGRLLDPSDYGIASYAIAIIALTQVFSDIRVNSALISIREVNRTHLDTGFTINLLRGFIVAGLLFAFAGPIADYANEPALVDVLRVLAVVLIFDGLKNPAMLMYRRNIDFSREFKRVALSTVLGSLAAITVAILTKSYWAIVAGTLAGRFAEFAFSYWRIPYMPKLGFRESGVFLRFGSWMTIDAILDYVTSAAPTMLLGRYAGSHALGFYTVGKDISQLATRELTGPLMQALFPGLAALAHDTPRLRVAYRTAQATVLGIALPIGFGSALLAPEMVALIVGQKWLAEAPQVIEVFGPVFAISMVGASTNGLAMAKLALPQMVMRAAFLAVFCLPIFWYAVSHHGASGMIYAVAFYQLLRASVNMFFAKTLLKDSFFSAFLMGWRSFVAVAVMSGAVLLMPSVSPAGMSEIAVFLSVLPRIAVAAVVYIAAHLALWRLSGKPDGFESKVLEILGKALERFRERQARRAG